MDFRKPTTFSHLKRPSGVSSFYPSSLAVGLSILMLVSNEVSAGGVWRAGAGGTYFSPPLASSPSGVCSKLVAIKNSVRSIIGADPIYSGASVSDPYPNEPHDLQCNFKVYNRNTDETRDSRTLLRLISGCPEGTNSGFGTDSCNTPSNSCGTTMSNPVSINGIKIQVEVDFIDPKGLLTFERIYHSSEAFLAPTSGYIHDKVWRHSFDKQLLVNNYSENPYILLKRPNHSDIVFFRNLDGEWKSPSHPGTYLTEPSEPTDDSRFSFTDQSGNVERYNSEGHLISIQYVNGNQISLTYQGGRLTTVQDNFSRILTFVNNAAGKISTLETYTGANYDYQYDSAFRLTGVTYPSLANESTSPTKFYHYENPNYRYLLTGITNENNVRYVTWQYDDQGRVTTVTDANDASEHFLYQDALTTVFTNKLGKDTVFQYDVINNHVKLVSVEGIATSQCLGSIRSKAYYPPDHPTSPGLLYQTTNTNGAVTEYEYNSRGLITKEVIAKGTDSEKTTLTEWHPTQNLKTKISNSTHVVEMSYDSNGLLLQQRSSPR